MEIFLKKKLMTVRYDTAKGSPAVTESGVSTSFTVMCVSPRVALRKSLSVSEFVVKG